MILFGEERFHRQRNRHGEREHMTHVNMRRGFGVIRLVLAGAAMTAADLVLPCEPGFIITGAAGVQDPLAETLAHRGKIMAVAA
jgi:hypothetical protein